MDGEQRSLIIRSFSHYSSSPGLELRSDESVLKSAAYKIGILAALRSIKSNSVTGVIITASGRSVKKKGVRIVDPDGGALIADWEPLADSVANVVDPDELVMLIEEFARKQNISVDGGQSGEVLLARDTSPSGEALFEAAKQGISSISGTVFHDMGILTSPQLHWLVHARNKDRKASEHDYFQRLSYSYRCLVDLIPEGATTGKTGESLVVDGANSVGGDKIKSLKDLCDGLAIEIRNTSKGGSLLDQGVGVDFIQEQKIVPSGFGCSDIGSRCASIDGDAGRFLYFCVLPSQKIEIVDGDKILFLFTLYINEQLAALHEVENEKEGHYHARLGILHNAYEIGASMNYLKNLGLDVVSFTPGTRSLQALASKYDIGIYFEVDGSGGILFSENYLLWLEAKNNELLSSSKGSTKQISISRLLAVSRLMNTTVSDALASLLMTEAILQHNGWSLQKWNEIYCDQTNIQVNEVELAENIAVAAENPKSLAVSHSVIEGEPDTLSGKSVSDEARSENAQHVSHFFQESKNIDDGPTESAGQQAVNYEAHSISEEQSHVDAAVGSEQDQKKGTTTIDQDVIFMQILKYLPVRSLVRFRCVCKEWMNYIDSQQFMEMHLNIQKPRFLGEFYIDQRLIAFEFCRLSELPFARTLRHPTEATAVLPIFFVWGSLHGVVCLYFTGKIIVWNPSVGRELIIPIPSDFEDRMLDFIFCSGFWIDPTSKEFKIVILLFGEEENKVQPAMTLYSSVQNDWITIPLPPVMMDKEWICTAEDMDHMIVIGGVGYWKGYFQKDEPPTNAILCFDFRQQSFDFIDMPNLVSPFWLIQWKGTLAVLKLRRRNPRRFDIYGRQGGSWINICRVIIPFSEGYQFNVALTGVIEERIWALFSTQSPTLIQNLGLYDDRVGCIPFMQDVQFGGAYHFVESLLFP